MGAKSVRAFSLGVRGRTAKSSRLIKMVCEIAHARKRNALSDRDKILQAGRYLRRSHAPKQIFVTLD